MPSRPPPGDGEVPAGLSVAVLHAAIPADAPLDELDTLVEAEAVSAALQALGHRAERVPLTLDLAAARAHLEACAPDLVFNLVESVDGRGALIHLGVGLVEALGIPCTGAGTGALVNTSNKVLAKRALRLAGIPTPPWFVDPADAPAGVTGPWIVKSVWEHGSVGVDDAGVVADAAAAAVLLGRRASERGGEWLAEAFVEGRELNLALLAGPRGPQVLPVGEIRFQNWPVGKPRIVNYAAKWHPQAFEYRNTPRSFDFPPEDTGLLAEARRIAVACWDLFELRGHARVDVRVDEAGRPWVLEVNANPCIAPEAGFCAMLDEAGIAYEEAVDRIVADALAGRRRRRSPGPRADGPRASSAAGILDRLTCRETVSSADREAVRAIVAATGFFSAVEVAIAVELVDEHLARGTASGYSFLLAQDGAELVGYTCYGPVAGTAASWDLYWIAVHPDWQGRGLGRALLERTAALARAAGGQQLYAETSSRTQYAPTRRFYERNGFLHAAYLPGFYGPGDGKVVYCRAILG